MIRNPASPARHDAGLSAPGLGRWLVAVVLGLVAMGVLALATVPAGVSAAEASVRPVMAVMSAGSPAKPPVMLTLERDVTAMTADIELLADPAMPGPTGAVVLPRVSGAAAFREPGVAPPPSAPSGSLLRPPRTA